jgi:hypothetical protein
LAALARVAAGSSFLAKPSGLPPLGRKPGSRSHFRGEIRRHFKAGADFDNDRGRPAHRVLLTSVFPAGDLPRLIHVSSLGAGRHPLLGAAEEPGRERNRRGAFVLALAEQESFVAAAKLFSQSRVNAGNRRRLFHLKAR